MTAICSWAFFVNAIILLAMDRIPWLRIRLLPIEEESDINPSRNGEFKYQSGDENITSITELAESKNFYTSLSQPVRSRVSVSTHVKNKIIQREHN